MPNKYYQPAAKKSWVGRIDHAEDYDYFRWHQVVTSLDLSKQKKSPVSDTETGFCFLGFCCDEGVRRNLGRTGAATAPLSIRKEMSNLPCSFDRTVKLFDAGNILCPNREMENAQDELATAVRKIISLKLRPIVLGGGHEVAFGHFRGLEDAKRIYAGDKKFRLGIVNFDAHFDLRPYGRGSNSGTMFSQIADLCRKKRIAFPVFYIGIQMTANTIGLFKTADRLKAPYVLAKDIDDSSLPEIYDQLNDFINRHDGIYLSICADVFSSAFASGVSSPQPFGLLPETGLHLMKHILRSGKVLSFDLAEVSPQLDVDHRTAKLAAVIIFAYLNTIVESADVSPRAGLARR